MFDLDELQEWDEALEHLEAQAPTSQDDDKEDE